MYACFGGFNPLINYLLSAAGEIFENLAFFLPNTLAYCICITLERPFLQN